MGRIMSMSQLVMALALVASLLQGTAADDHTVGNAAGWTNTQGATFYSNWTANITFEVGDELVFNFVTGQHDVAVVTKDAFDSCNTTTNPINTTQAGPATVRLNSTGPHYFICTIGSHCSQGQKLFINVVDENGNPSPPTTGTTPPTTNTTSPPPPSSASPRGVAFAFVFMSLAIAFFCC